MPVCFSRTRAKDAIFHPRQLGKPSDKEFQMTEQKNYRIFPGALLALRLLRRALPALRPMSVDPSTGSCFSWTALGRRGTIARADAIGWHHNSVAGLRPPEFSA
jgi:hypothetical protein